MSQMNEEQKIEMMNRKADELSKLRIFQDIPYGVFNLFIENKNSSNFFQGDLNNIKQYYQIYQNGATFSTEGTNSDYVPSTLKYKLVRSLIKKEARFLFSETPDMNVIPGNKSDNLSNKDKENASMYNSFLKKVLSENNMDIKLIRAAKDCFIGKRVAGLVNFNEENGITIDFLSALNFYFENDRHNPNKIVKFVSITSERVGLMLKDNQYFVKHYRMEDDKVYLKELVVNGSCEIVEAITEETVVDGLKEIPVVIITNDGLLNDIYGESEVEEIGDFEKEFSKLSNADEDSERKGMNQIKYTIDMDENSTKNLPSGPGSHWDLIQDQSLNNAKPSVGVLNTNLEYSGPLKTTLDRIKMSAYELLDMPNVNMETMQGSITSGKSLKAIYWPLIVRCNEKMKIWAPSLEKLISLVFEGANSWPDIAKKYLPENVKLDSTFDYMVEVINNLPLPEDEAEEKNIDLNEVDAKVMSKRAYMKKWRGLTDAEVDEELKNLAKERQVIEDSVFITDNTGIEDGSGEENEEV